MRLVLCFHNLPEVYSPAPFHIGQGPPNRYHLIFITAALIGPLRRYRCLATRRSFHERDETLFHRDDLGPVNWMGIEPDLLLPYQVQRLLHR